VEEGERLMRWAASLALAFAVCGSACAQENPKTQKNEALVICKNAIGSFRLNKYLENTPLLKTAEMIKTVPECDGIDLSEILETFHSSGEVQQVSVQQQIHSMDDLLEVVRSPDDIEVVSPWRGGINCTGVAQQGGAVLCQTTPNAKVKRTFTSRMRMKTGRSSLALTEMKRLILSKWRVSA